MATPESSSQYVQAFTTSFGARGEQLQPKEMAVMLEQFAYILMDRAEEMSVSQEVVAATGQAYENLETSDMLNLMSVIIENAKKHL